MVTRIKAEQDRKFREMVEGEKVKADNLEIEKMVAAEKEAVELVKKLEEAEKRKNWISELKEEPTSGEIINVAFRLPNGVRLTRNFLQNEPIKVCVF